MQINFSLPVGTLEEASQRVVVKPHGEVHINATIAPEQMKVRINTVFYNKVDVRSLFETFAAGILEQEALNHIRNQ
jgi:hypothetical protein